MFIVRGDPEIGIIRQVPIVQNWFTLSTDIFPEAIDLSEWISQAQAARLRGVSRQAIANLVRHQRLGTLDVAGRRLVRRKDILAFEPLQPGRPKEKE
ncbi:MAG: helix-turn-helix domain-containing protein [Candidatus Accumulibacter sp. UW25]